MQWRATIIKDFGTGTVRLRVEEGEFEGKVYVLPIEDWDVDE
jgi:hypothetical protein